MFATRIPNHKPKDGDISGPIQVNDMAWVIIQRVKQIPAAQYDPKDPALQSMLRKQMFDAKLQEAMTDLMNELLRNSAVDNRLTGTVKEKNEEEDPAFLAAKETKLKLMGGQTDDPNVSKAGRSVNGKNASSRIRDHRTQQHTGTHLGSNWGLG